MQPILMLAIVGVAATAMGVGFLSNTITLNVQQLGVGEADFKSPITLANIDLEVNKVNVGQDGSAFFKNVINVCSFHSPDELDDPALNDLLVICKLTDANGKVIAEGSKDITYFPSTTYTIDITEEAFPGATQVQNVHDITLVVLGHNPTGPAP